MTKVDLPLKIDDQNPKIPPTASSSFQQKKLEYDSESNYKDFKSENIKNLASLFTLISLISSFIQSRDKESYQVNCEW